ncbi:MAG: VCBS repeat-containing protein, partial [Chloroflexi bacterium]
GRVKLADIDGDGDLDAVIGAEHANRLIWAEAPDNPEDMWPEHVISTDSPAMSMDVGDLDRDGDPDIVIGEHVGNGRIFVFQNEDQGSSWTATEIDSGVEHHVGTQLIDIDNDGDLDIISTGWDNTLIMLYENNAIVNPGDR